MWVCPRKLCSGLRGWWGRSGEGRGREGGAFPVAALEVGPPTAGQGASAPQTHPEFS